MIPENTQLGQTSGSIGHQLTRPECALAHQSGLVLVPNWADNGGISVISPRGDTHHIIGHFDHPLRPNGIALEDGGTILLAHLGDTTGGIFRLSEFGEVESVVSTVNGEPMPPANYVVLDRTGRIWITVSTRLVPRAADYRADAQTGFIAVAQPGDSNARIVADGLGYTNECVIDEQRNVVWVNETFGRRLTRFALQAESEISLRDRTTVCHFGPGTYPDGLAMDTQGNLWVTSIVSNRILKVSPEGVATTVFEDSEQAHIDWTEQAYLSNSLGREHLDNACGKVTKNISNVAFGGPALNRLYLGNLLGDSLPYIDVHETGVAMPHWQATLGGLKQFL